MQISKSDFLQYKNCPEQFWFSKNKPEVLTEHILDDFVERLKLQGAEVELFARGLYPEAVLVTEKLDKAASQTADLIAQGTQQIFQASFIADDLFAACDVLVWNAPFQGWDIIEIKSSTYKAKRKKRHYKKHKV